MPGDQFAWRVVLHLSMPLNRQAGPKRSVFATFLVAAVLVAFGGVERFAPVVRRVDPQPSWHAASLSAEGAGDRSCGALVIGRTAGALQGNRAPSVRAFMPSRRAWVGSSVSCGSDPITSSIGFVVDASVSRTHDATGPPSSLLA